MPRFAPDAAVAAEEELFEPGVGARTAGVGVGSGSGAGTAGGAGTGGSEAGPGSWPSDALEQLAAVRALAFAQPLTADEAAARLVGACREVVAQHLEALAIIGELRRDDEGRYCQAAGEVGVGGS